MAKTIDLVISTPMHPGAVRLGLLDAETLRQIALAAGATAATVTVDGDVTTIVRTIEVPESARTMLKASTIDVTEVRTWGLSGADVDIQVVGMPLTMKGRLDLQGTGIHCLVHATGSIEAKMSFMGPLVESMLRERMIESIRAEIEALR
jgi:hypothetical protein